jgi:hypothetical protein
VTGRRTMNVIELTASSLDVLRPATRDMRGDGLITTPAPVCESWPTGLMPDDYMLGCLKRDDFSTLM